jgi:uncharacterized protein (TIGR02145 family)
MFMKKKNRIWIYLLLTISIVYLFTNSCKKDEEKKASIPSLTTKTPTQITSNSVILGGDVYQDGGSAISERGICYSKHESPSIEDFVIAVGSGTGTFQSSLFGLDPNTKYYARAYAINAVGTGYGNLESFTTEATNFSPIAAFTATPTSGITPLSVSFTDQSANNPTSWIWNFGDGNISTLQNPNHTYIQVGTYSIQLTATNNYGSNIVQKNNYINVTSGGGMGNVTDIDGNSYQTVIIGNQRWMVENLKVTHYRNGDEIPNITGNTQWNSVSTGAYCWESNDIKWKDAYGALYNWYTVTDSRELCPSGWHTPTISEWTILVDHLGGKFYAGAKMKSTRTEPDAHPRWDLPNSGANNDSGFSGLPGGSRLSSGSFSGIGRGSSFWSSTESSSTTSWFRTLSYGGTGVGLADGGSKNHGLSVRCIKD